jgi:serine/threonine-protein kinase haspin
VLALAVAEEAVDFEHRDLHWGNLLIRRVPVSQRIHCHLR